MSCVNDFLVGADPEFIIVENGHMKRINAGVEPYAPWGLDHQGWVGEPHPKPEVSVRALVNNLRVAFNDFATVAPSGRWRAGAYAAFPERIITLGGHIHIDKPTCMAPQVGGLDLFTRHLEALDILPRAECGERRSCTANHARYGQFSDVRIEHGHFEYRTQASWLFSQRVTKICLTGAKLIVVDPAAPTETLGPERQASVSKLKAFFERFQHKDDDADWLLSGKIFDKKLAIDPEKDLRSVWKVEPVKENPRWKEEDAKRKQTLFKEGEFWPEGIASRDVSTSIDGVRYYWWIPYDQPMSDEMRTQMRLYVQQDRWFESRNRVLVRGGCTFMPRRYYDPGY